RSSIGHAPHGWQSRMAGAGRQPGGAAPLATEGEYMSGELTWDHAVLDIPESGLSTVRRATPDELEQIARTLELIECCSLAATYTIMPVGGGHFRLRGRLEAALQQACVVTLEPVPQVIDEPFDAVFRPQADIPAPASGEIDLDDEPDIEPI